MQVAKITKVYVNPPQTNEFTVEIYWKYPGEATYRFFGERVASADGTFSNPASILYDEGVNMNIEIRLVFAYCPSTVPYVYTHTGAVTTTSTTTISPAKAIINSTSFQVDFAINNNTDVLEAGQSRTINDYDTASVLSINILAQGGQTYVRVVVRKDGVMIANYTMAVGDSQELPAEYDSIEFLEL